MHILSLATLGKEQKFSPSTINTALKWLADKKNHTLAPAKYDIGNGCFAIIQEYDPKPFTESEFENHHQKIDIQFLVSGKEFLYWTNQQESNKYQVYNADKDIEFFTPLANESNYTRIALDGDRAVILWPGDWHMPCVEAPIGNNMDKKVKKIVIKIPVN